MLAEIKGLPLQTLIMAIQNDTNIEHMIPIEFGRNQARLMWGKIEEYLTDVDKFRSFIIKQRPDLAEVLSTSEGVSWLNRKLPILYDVAYTATWSEESE